MPVIGGGGSGPVSGFPLAADVVDSVADDLLQRIAPEDPILLDYINRVQLQLLRASRWKFLLSAPQRFVTQNERTDYWIGTAGSAPLGATDTGLNITNNGPIKTDSFYDRSNFRLLKRTDEGPLLSRFAFRDESYRPGQPRLWRNAPDTPSIINIYPAPDNQNGFQPEPEAPSCGYTSGGSLPARFYFIRATYVDSLGNEGSSSDEARVFIPANNVVVVQPPIEIPAAASGVLYNRYNLYIYNAGTSTTLTTGQETLATASPLTNTGSYTEPNTGFTTGGRAFPTSSTLEQMAGYLIEFRYFQAKPQVTSLTNALLIPQDYLDVLIAGVNYFAAQYIKDLNAAQYWKGEYDTGLIGMIRDKNLFPRGPEFISPDPTSISSSNWWGYETFSDFWTPGA